MSRTVQPWTAAIAALLAFGGSAQAQRHPHFDDRGTLAWQIKLADSQQAARQADKIIFVEVGAKT